MANLTNSHREPVENRGRITARVPLNVQELLQQAADLLGATVNQFVVQSALDAAEKVIAKERVIALSNEEAKRFCELLDNPPAPNAALRNALTRYNARKESNEVSDRSFGFEA